MQQDGTERGGGNSSESRRLTSAAVAVTALFSGASVMVYELIAVRFLQRSFGSTVDVWAAEIAVCMAGLAIGYWVGGRLADRYNSWRVLGKALVFAGGTGLFMERLADGFGDAFLQLEPAWWHSLVAACACSFLPLLALGTVLPQAIRLQVQRLEEVGSATGWVAALSTAGSIVGVLLTPLVFMRHFGVRETLYGSALALMAFGTATTLAGRKASRKTSIAAGLVLCITSISYPASADVIFEKYTAHHHILVRDRGDERALYFDNAPQSTMSKANPETGGFEYTDFFHVPMVLDPTIDSVLFVGLGGATGPKAFLRDYRQVRVDVVEVDPVVLEVATDFFHLRPTRRLRVTIADGRVFLRRSKQTYGAIMMDAYASGRYGAFIPYHLVTQEFFEIAWQHLVNGGCLAYNVIGVHGGDYGSMVADVHATLEAVFQQVYVFQARTSQNTVFVAQKIDVGALHENGTRDGAYWPEGPWLDHPLDEKGFLDVVTQLQRKRAIKSSVLAQRVRQFSRANLAPSTGRVLTDNFAPVDVSGGWGRR